MSMTKLNDIAAILRSKNAGPLNVTFDIMFADKDAYLRVRDSGALTAEAVAKLYDVSPADVEVIAYDIVDSIKVTIPRATLSGALDDMDVYGCQQHGPLSTILIP